MKDGLSFKPGSLGALAEQASRPLQIVPPSINAVLTNPAEEVAYLYHSAKNALTDLLNADPRGWTDVLVMLRTMAKDRRADLIERMLDDARPVMDKAARYQDTADSWRDPADDDSRIKDEQLIRDQYGVGGQA